MRDRFFEEFAVDILCNMPKSKKEVLRRALDRNQILTSVRIMEFGKIHVYKEGFYLVLEGTRCGFRVWAGDNDSSFVFGRKPIDKKLHLLHKTSLHFDEGDFEGF